MKNWQLLKQTLFSRTQRKKRKPGCLVNFRAFINKEFSMTNIEIFIDLMDSLFWEGYTKQLSADNPAKFNFEYNEFLNNYTN